MMDLLQLKQTELEVLNSGVWGTIAPHSVSAAKALAELTGAAHGLLCHSETAAYESVLRYLGASLSELPHGDVVVVGEESVPLDSLNALCVEATPLFCPVCKRCGMISPKALGECLKHAPLPLRAVVLDYHADRAGEYPLDVISALCREHHVPLILMAGGHIGANHDGKPLTAYAEAVIYSLGEGSAVDAGGGGLVVTDDQALWMGAFAYHNCGRAPGAGCSLVMDAIVGGDMRVTEWIAVVAEEILRQNAMAIPTPRTPVLMKGQPVFANL
ncbi:MAG: DegT/DnrJ/EryC1/StrS family aminotransferase [Clostridia bacterium]|nr:DegT/DnrJ/EryC1/StrS family aminotransferase [Clostridia bacterium]